MVGSAVFDVQKYLYAKGTHARYVMASLKRVCDIGVIIALPVLAGLAAAQQSYVVAGIAGSFFLINLWLFIQRFDDDDHWFNDQWKRLKRGIKKLRQNLASTNVLPSPSPA